MAYSKPKLDEVEELSIAPDVGTCIVVIVGADTVIAVAAAVFGLNTASGSHSSANSQLSNLPPFATNAAGSTFNVTLTRATIDGNKRIRATCMASFPNPDLFGPNPMPVQCVPQNSAYFAVSGFVVENSQLIELGSTRFPFVTMQMGAQNGQAQLEIIGDASALDVAPGASFGLAVFAGGALANANSTPSMNPALGVSTVLDATQAVPVAGWPWLLGAIPAVAAGAAVRKRRRGAAGKAADESGDVPAGGATRSVFLVNLGWMRKQRGAQVLQREIEKA